MASVPRVAKPPQPAKVATKQRPGAGPRALKARATGPAGGVEKPRARKPARPPGPAASAARPGASADARARKAAGAAGAGLASLGRADAAGGVGMVLVGGGGAGDGVDVDSAAAPGVGGSGGGGGGSGGVTLAGSLDEYRQGVLRLEKARHTRVQDAERRYLYHMRAVRSTYDQDRRQAEEEFDVQRRNIAFQALRDNAERMRDIEERRYGVKREEAVNSSYSRRHEMSLRRGGRSAAAAAGATGAGAAAGGGGEGEDPGTAAGSTAGFTALGPGFPGFGSGLPGDPGDAGEDLKEKPSRRGKKKDDAARALAAQKQARFILELHEDEIADDMLAFGVKRSEPDAPAKDEPPAKKTKKRK